MKLERVLYAKAARLLNVAGADGGEVYGINLVRALEARYGFLQGPRTLEEFDWTNGVAFFHGYFNGRHVIDQFRIFSNGVYAEAKLESDVCDEFISDAVAWARDEAGLRIEEPLQTVRFYFSHLEVAAPFSLAEKLERLNRIGAVVGNHLREYGQESSEFTLLSLGYGAAVGQPVSFNFEHRVGAQEEGIFFSSAPLRTHDHFLVLQRFEELLSG